MSEEREALEQAAALLERLIAHARGETEFSDEAVAVSVPAVLNMIYAAIEMPADQAVLDETERCALVAEKTHAPFTALAIRRGA